MLIDLPAIAARYCESRILASDYEKTLLRTARSCQQFTSVNKYLRHRLETRSSTTAKNDRDMICILLRWAYEEGLIDQYPRGIAKIKATKEPTKAWNLEQCCTAVKATSKHFGKTFRSGADLGIFLRCWLRLGYETGGRWGDLWKLRKRHFDGNVVRYSQNKTGTGIFSTLTDECMADVKAMLARSPDDRVLGWVCNKRWAMRLMRRHLDACGIGGSSKWLRRSAATQIEIDHPGQAKLFLGHKTSGMAERFYIDWAQVRRDVPRPPALLK